MCAIATDMGYILVVRMEMEFEYWSSVREKWRKMLRDRSRRRGRKHFELLGLKAWKMDSKG